MKCKVWPKFRSMLPALTAVLVTTLLAVSFVGSTRVVQGLGGV